MKKIEIDQPLIFLMAKFLKDRFPEEKIYLHQKSDKIVIYFNNKKDVILIKEIITLLKIHFPEIKVIFESFLPR